MNTFLQKRFLGCRIGFLQDFVGIVQIVLSDREEGKKGRREEEKKGRREEGIRVVKIV